MNKIGITIKMSETSNETVKKRGRPRSMDKAAALDIATRLFWERGYEGTSISDLTSAMGINPPSLYSTFGSKDALFREALTHYAARETTKRHVMLDEAPS